MAEPDSVGVLILAAGASRRLGRPKQLLRLDGRTLLQHVIDAASASGIAPIVVVLGHAADRIAASLQLPEQVRIVVNADHATGQASSLVAGLSALNGDVERAVVLLSDQPRISEAAIRNVAFGTGPIRRARYRNGVGHPVAFDRSVWPWLFECAGDQGARTVIAAHPGLVVHVDIDGDVPVDVDTDDDARAVGVSD